MPPSLSPKDDRVLHLLVEKDLITRAQEQRVRGAVARGMPLAEALQKTPLVDPIKFATIQALAASTPDPGPLEPSRPEDTQPVPTVREVPPPTHKANPPSGEIELDLLDDSEPFETESGTFKIKNLGPVQGADETQVPSPDDEGRRTTESSIPIHLAATTYEEPDTVITSDLPEDFDDDLDFDEFDKAESTTEIVPGASAPAPPPPANGDDLSDLDDLDDLDELDELDDLDFDQEDEETLPPHLPQRTGDDFDHEVQDKIDEVLDLDMPEVSPPPDGAVADAPTAPGGAALYSHLPPPLRTSGFIPKGQSPQNFDLSDDEGILLIEEVNALLRDAIEHQRLGLLLAPGEPSAQIKLYTAAGTLDEERTLEPEMIEKVVNRLKVMARIETWRNDARQQGAFDMTFGKQRARALVSTEGEGRDEILVVYISATPPT